MILFLSSLQLTAGTAKHPLFTKEIVSSIFTPALNDAGQATFSSMMKADPSSPWEEGVQWSTACAVNMTDWPGRRKKCSGSCKCIRLYSLSFLADLSGFFFRPSLNFLKGFGWANTSHFIDPTTGVAVYFGTQALPSMDSVTSDYFARLETVLYKALE